MVNKKHKDKISINKDNLVFMDSKKKMVSPKKEFYHKYRWYFTNSNKLVYGGKSAEQNEEVVHDLLKNKKNRILMHTKISGSPFAIVEDYVGSVTLEDMNEVAIWTACFSRAWRSNLKKTTVDIFLSEQVVKNKGMKSGTFSVFGKIDRIDVELKLVLCKQKGVLRAVPENSVEGKVLGVIVPGEIQKEKFAEEISLKYKINKEEVLNALPTGRFKWGK